MPEVAFVAASPPDRYYMNHARPHDSACTTVLLLSTTCCLQALVHTSLASFLLMDLRRFAMFDSTATRPYTSESVDAMQYWSSWSMQLAIGLIAMPTVLVARRSALMRPVYAISYCF